MNAVEMLQEYIDYIARLAKGATPSREEITKMTDHYSEIVRLIEKGMGEE